MDAIGIQSQFSVCTSMIRSMSRALVSLSIERQMQTTAPAAAWSGAFNSSPSLTRH
jgi:hypothetical protein